MTGCPSPDRRPTIYDVAERAGVSKSLVSLVLRNSPQVSDPRRAAVMSAIRELGYRPSRAATVLASRRTHHIEVLIDDYSNPWFVEMVRSMQAVLIRSDYRLTVTESQVDRVVGGSGLDAAPQVDGRVLAAEPDDALLRGWATNVVPTVVAGWRLRIPPEADLVASDEEVGAGLATAHLHELGHSVIGHLTGSGGSAHHRRAGYLRQVAAAGSVPLVVGEGGGTTEEDGYQAAAALLTDRPDTTAIFAANDSMALGALAAIRQRGGTVPGDLSVLGYDNSVLARSRYLELTSVDACYDAIGATAARVLLDRIDDPTLEPHRTLLPPTLIVRGTTGRPR